MKKIFIFFCLLPFISFSQSQKTTNLLEEIRGKYSHDESGDVTYQKVIDVPETPKEALFTRAETYIAMAYKDANSVIQSRDKEAGIIIGKGIYADVFKYQGIFTAYCSFSHVIRIDCKDNKTRIVISLTELKEKRVANGDASYFDFQMSEIYPFNWNGSEKNITGQAFYYAHKRVLENIAEIEKALLNKNQISTDW
jgi:hypothetical protein